MTVIMVPAAYYVAYRKDDWLRREALLDVPLCDSTIRTSSS